MRKNTLFYPVKADNETTTFRAFIGVLHVILTLIERLVFFRAERAFDLPTYFDILIAKRYKFHHRD